MRDQVQVYSEPNSASGIAASLQKGEEYPIVESARSYYKIQMLGGKQGWVKKSQVQHKKVKRVVMSWNFGGSTNLYMQQSASANQHVVSPRWYVLSDKKDPMVSIQVDPAYVKWAHDNGKQIWPLFGNRFDPELTRSLLSSPEKRQKVVAAIKESLVQYQIDGINVDFENVDIRNKADFVAFVQELSDALKPLGKVVSVDVARISPDPNWSGSYDRAGLGKAADYVILMGYDEHWNGGGKAGSVASLPWTEEGITLLMNEVPSHKIILGVPFYTREWVTDPATGKVTGIDRSMGEVEKLVAERGLQKIRDVNISARQSR
ncbi:glycosyl hydrolase family 18 protein [Effusibacillus consociatus]|uniref:Glycosyl hydrolase family 18 protein n=1 Tax=Effusibacillus consociatus TaxID=1117041 RepID=A0ABV9Q4Z5_9BACL